MTAPGSWDGLQVPLALGASPYSLPSSLFVCVPAVPQVSSHCPFLGMEQQTKRKARTICMAATGFSLLRSEALLQPVLATRPPLFLNVLPRRWRNTLVVPELCHQSSAELLLTRPLSGFPNSRPPARLTSSFPSRPTRCWGPTIRRFGRHPTCSPGKQPAGGGPVEIVTRGHQVELHGHYFQEPLDRRYERQQQRSSWTLNSTPRPIPQQSTFHPGNKSCRNEGELTISKEQILPRHLLQHLSLHSSKGETQMFGFPAFTQLSVHLRLLCHHKMLGFPALVLHWAVPAAQQGTAMGLISLDGMR